MTDKEKKELGDVKHLEEDCCFKCRKAVLACMRRTESKYRWRLSEKHTSYKKMLDKVREDVETLFIAIKEKNPSDFDHLSPKEDGFLKESERLINDWQKTTNERIDLWQRNFESRVLTSLYDKSKKIEKIIDEFDSHRARIRKLEYLLGKADSLRTIEFFDKFSE